MHAPLIYVGGKLASAHAAGGADARARAADDRGIRRSGAVPLDRRHRRRTPTISSDAFGASPTRTRRAASSGSTGRCCCARPAATSASIEATVRPGPRRPPRVLRVHRLHAPGARARGVHDDHRPPVARLRRDRDPRRHPIFATCRRAACWNRWASSRRARHSARRACTAAVGRLPLPAEAPVPQMRRQSRVRARVARRRPPRRLAYVRVVDADPERGAALERRDHVRRELEAQEMHGRRLLVVLARQVLVGDRVDLRVPFRPGPTCGPRCRRAARARRGARRRPRTRSASSP